MTNALYKNTIGLITRKQAGGSEEDGEWIIAGKYTDDKIDLHGHMIDREAMIRALPTYKQWNTLREMHETPIGTVKSIGEPEWNDIEASIAKTTRGKDAWENVQAGVYKAFSVGILVTDGYFLPVKELDDEAFSNIDGDMRALIEEIEYVFKITGLVLVENSIVDRPANPGARAKALREAGMSEVKGALPEVKSAEGIDIIKSVFPRSKEKLHVVTTNTYGYTGDSSTVLFKVENGTVTLINESDITDSKEEKHSASTQNSDPDKESNVNKHEKDVTEQPELEVETEAKSEEVETETEEVEVEIEPTAEVEEVENEAETVEAQDVARENVVSQEFMDDTQKSLSDINSGISKLVDMFSKYFEAVENSAEADENEQTDESVENDVAESDTQIDVDKLAEQITEKVLSMINVRKSAVTDDSNVEVDSDKDADSESDTVSLSTVDKSALRKAMGSIAAGIVASRK